MSFVRKAFPYAKALVAILWPAVQLFVAANTDNTVTQAEWKDVISKAAVAALVFLVPAPGYKAPGDAPSSGLAGNDRTRYHPLHTFPDRDLDPTRNKPPE